MAMTSIIGRIVIKGKPPQQVKEGEKILLDVFEHRWPKNGKVKFLITPGGFITAKFRRRWDGNRGWKSRVGDIEPFIESAQLYVKKVVTTKVLDAAKGKVDVLTIGVDVESIHDDTHAELVAIFDVNSSELKGWTGKSYPIQKQERTLVQVSDLDSHFRKIAGERVLILGCHDLNMWNPRGRYQQKKMGERYKRCRAMDKLLKKYKPTVILQHPHTTDTPNIWRLAWLTLTKKGSDIKAWASGICYWNPSPETGRSRKCRKKFSEVLAKTCSSESGCLDIVVSD